MLSFYILLFLFATANATYLNKNGDFSSLAAVVDTMIPNQHSVDNLATIKSPIKYKQGKIVQLNNPESFLSEEGTSINDVPSMSAADQTVTPSLATTATPTDASAIETVTPTATPFKANVDTAFPTLETSVPSSTPTAAVVDSTVTPTVIPTTIINYQTLTDSPTSIPFFETSTPSATPSVIVVDSTAIPTVISTTITSVTLTDSPISTIPVDQEQDKEQQPSAPTSMPTTPSGYADEQMYLNNGDVDNEKWSMLYVFIGYAFALIAVVWFTGGYFWRRFRSSLSFNYSRVNNNDLSNDEDDLDINDNSVGNRDNNHINGDVELTRAERGVLTKVKK